MPNTRAAKSEALESVLYAADALERAARDLKTWSAADRNAPAVRHTRLIAASAAMLDMAEKLHTFRANTR